MSDIDDLRSLTEDDDDFSFDDLDFDEGEVSFERMGRAIGEEDDDVWADTGSAGTSSPTLAGIQEVVFSMNSLERMILSALWFGIVVVLGFGLLLATGRIG